MKYKLTTNTKKYNIMHDYGSEGFGFYKENGVPKDFDTIGIALVFGMHLGYTTKFIIVSVVDFTTLIKRKKTIKS